MQEFRVKAADLNSLTLFSDKNLGRKLRFKITTCFVDKAARLMK